MQTIAITQTVHQTTYRHLGSRILYSDTAHDTTSNRRLNSIRHASSLLQRVRELQPIMSLISDISLPWCEPVS